MIKFEKVSAFKDVDFNLPERKTANSAGYDMVVVEDTLIPPMDQLWVQNCCQGVEIEIPLTLEKMAEITKKYKIKPTLVPTGVKCYLDSDTYLELSVRSSTPLKYWLILANGVGIIDADYADNPDNEGHIYFQIINLSPFPIQLKKGDIIGQGIIKRYEIVEGDAAAGLRAGGFGSTTK